jgi:small subunit ribosomal protein S20
VTAPRTLSSLAGPHFVAVRASRLDDLRDERRGNSPLLGDLTPAGPESGLGFGSGGRSPARGPSTALVEAVESPLGPLGRTFERLERILAGVALPAPFRFAFTGHCSYRYSPRPLDGSGTGPAGAAVAMANIASQKKRIARTERERTENRRLTSTVKTHFRRLEEAVEAGDGAKVAEEHRLLVSKIDKAVSKGAFHRNNGARKKAKAARIAARA